MQKQTAESEGDDVFGVLDDAATLDDAGIGLTGLTEQVSVALPPQDDDDDIDDDVTGDEIVPVELVSDLIIDTSAVADESTVSRLSIDTTEIVIELPAELPAVTVDEPDAVTAEVVLDSEDFDDPVAADDAANDEERDDAEDADAEGDPVDDAAAVGDPVDDAAADGDSADATPPAKRAPASADEATDDEAGSERGRPGARPSKRGAGADATADASATAAEPAEKRAAAESGSVADGAEPVGTSDAEHDAAVAAEPETSDAETAEDEPEPAPARAGRAKPANDPQPSAVDAGSAGVESAPVLERTAGRSKPASDRTKPLPELADDEPKPASERVADRAKPADSTRPTADSAPSPVKPASETSGPLDDEPDDIADGSVEVAAAEHPVAPAAVAASVEIERAPVVRKEIPVEKDRDAAAVVPHHTAETRAQIRSEVALTSKRLGDTSRDASRESADLLTADRLLDPSKVVRPEPEGAWSHFVYTISGRRINLGDSRKVRAQKELSARIAAPLHGTARFVPVLSRKGGVGKTTVTALLGMALADARDDRVIAVDANPDRGTLADRVDVHNGRSVRDLVRVKDDVRGFHDISELVTRDHTRLDVLASDVDPRVAEAFGDADYRDVASVAAHYYSLVLTDTGTGIVHDVMGATLDLADQLIIVSALSVDAARLASETLTWLETNGYAEKAADAIVVLNQSTPGSSPVRADEIEAHFSSRVDRVVRVPYDPQIAGGGPIEFANLAPETRAAARSLAAMLVEGLRAPAAAR